MSVDPLNANLNVISSICRMLCTTVISSGEGSTFPHQVPVPDSW
jgi:hypothetical protein